MQLSSRTTERHSWVAVLVILSFAAFLDARALGALVSLELTPSAAELARGGEHLAPAVLLDAGPERTTSADMILRRNPFDSVTGSLLDTGEIHGDPSAAPLDMAPCAGLRAEIIVTSHEPAWSFAVIAMANEPKAVLRRSGGSVGDKEVVYVARDRVWLRTHAGTLCQARIFAPKGEAPEPLVVTTPVRGSERPLDPAIAKGIVLVGRREYQIDRGVIDRIFAEYAELLKGTAVTPEKENGRTVGVRLTGIRAGTVLAALGIENGDRVVTVNGFDVTDPEKALTAFGVVRSAPRIVVELSRGGPSMPSMKLQYDVR